MSARVQLIHWNDVEGGSRAAALRRAGYDVRFESFDPFPAALKRLKADPPDAIVIDLTRLPSAGRDVALAIREAKSTRKIPIVFVDGEPDKISAIKSYLPDATYATWRAVRTAVKRAVQTPPANPVVPESRLAGYSGTPLPRKLGIKAGAIVALLGAPAGFERRLRPVPDGVEFRHHARGSADLIVWFPRSRAELERRVSTMRERIGRDGLWIAWPKKASGVPSDLSEPVVRTAGLGNGLVDYKIAAIDEIFSGLKFTRRRYAISR